jgi:hypothetical protein
MPSAKRDSRSYRFGERRPKFRNPRSAIRISHRTGKSPLPGQGLLLTNIPQSAFPTIRNSRFSFVMQAKPAEGIGSPIWGGNL